MMDPQDPGQPHGISEAPPATPLVKAIETGEPASVQRFVENLTPDERRRELTAECVGSGHGQGDVAGLPSAPQITPTVMLPVFHAASLGNPRVFLAVHDALRTSFSDNAVGRLLTLSTDSRNRNLLATALHSGSAPVVCALVDLLDSYKVEQTTRVHMLGATDVRNQTSLIVAVQTGEEAIVQAMMRLVGDDWVPADAEEAGIITGRDIRGWSPLFYAVASGRTAIVDAVVSLLERVLAPDEVNPALDDCLPLAMSEVLGSNVPEREKRAMEALSCLIKHGAGLTPRQLSLVGTKAGFETTKECLLDAICGAVNPLLVGMRLSLKLAEAGGFGNEGQRQVAARLQQQVEDLVLEVFERLPQTVDGFREGDIAGSGMEACSTVFTPEKMRPRVNGNLTQYYGNYSGGNRVQTGPLAIALQARPQLELFCTQALVLDFLSRSFTRGLPALDASEARTLEADEVKLWRQQSTSVQAGATAPGGTDGRDGAAEDVSQELMKVLEGPHHTFGSLTLLPGSQFILAQLVARPAFCYSVPAVRMGMDLFVYALMLYLFAKEVLWYEGSLGLGEVIFFVYVLGAILVEINELWDGREDYMKDHWNLLDVAALAFCGSAFLVRLYDPDSLWGRALYGGGAPLLLFRTLFFAQFLPAQGPMIEIIFSLAGELLRFCTILLVTMMGFAMSFHALFRHSCTVDAFRTPWSTWISLLRALLGETKVYDDLTVAAECCLEVGQEPSDELHCEDFLMECCHNVDSEHFNGLVGKALLASYNVVMGIILLNLLIAVLSEAYVDVKENINTEAKVSRTLVIRHYMQAVEEDMLPSPLNLVQYFVSVLAMLVGILVGEKGVFRKAEYFSGLALFWFVSGMFAVCAGSILWLASWPKGIYAFFERRPSHPMSGVSLTSQVAVLTCGVVMPLFLVYKWLWESACGALWRHLTRAWSNEEGFFGYSEINGDRSHPHDEGIVGEALKKYSKSGQGASLNVQQLREFLANPMEDPIVQRDEEDRETTVEHLKLLRDNLTKMVGRRVDELSTGTAAKIEGLEASLDDRVSALSVKVDRVDEKLSEILRKLN